MGEWRVGVHESLASPTRTSCARSTLSAVAASRRRDPIAPRADLGRFDCAKRADRQSRPAGHQRAPSPVLMLPEGSWRSSNRRRKSETR